MVFGIAILSVLARPLYHLGYTWMHDEHHQIRVPARYADDASRLNRTPIAERFVVPSPPDSAEQQLTELLRRAQREHLHISIAGAQHTMGGHTITRDGILVDMTSFHGMQLDADGIHVHVRAGTRWAELIPYLDRHRRSVAIMQSNNDFTIGGALSANAHGWQPNRPPLASSIERMRVMLADGQIIECSRTDHRELFSLILGGYGMFAIVLDVDLVTVPNERYRARRYRTTSEGYASLFAKTVEGHESIGLAYGRLSVVPRGYLRDATLTVFEKAPSAKGSVPPLTPIGPLRVAREVFRGSVGNTYGKTLRWDLETWLGATPGHRYVSRNQILNVSSDFFANTSETSTDILHEYFIPKRRLEEFLVQVRRIIPAHHADLLNVTIRDVQPDTDGTLRYAREPVFGLVMLFNQGRSVAADDSARALTKELIDAAIRVGGTYYLPYRLHATPEQLERAYPNIREVFARKRVYDPNELFRNGFYDTFAPSLTNRP